jgi:hypothetical protein
MYAVICRVHPLLIQPESDREADLAWRRLPAIRAIFGPSVTISLGGPFVPPCIAMNPEPRAAAEAFLRQLSADAAALEP